MEAGVRSGGVDDGVKAGARPERVDDGVDDGVEVRLEDGVDAES